MQQQLFVFYMNMAACVWGGGAERVGWERDDKQNGGECAYVYCTSRLGS